MNRQTSNGNGSTTGATDNTKRDSKIYSFDVADDNLDLSDIAPKRKQQSKCSTFGCAPINKKIRHYFSASGRAASVLRIPSMEDACCHSDHHEHQNSIPICYLRQIYFALIISSGIYLSSLVVGWTSFLRKVESTQYLNTYINDNDVRWLAAIPTLASIPGALLGYFLMQATGPANLQRYVTGASVIFCGLNVFWPSAWMLYLFRVIIGLLLGMMYILVVPLIVELSEPNTRGHFAAIPEIIISLGLIYTYLITNYVSWTLGAVLCFLPLLINLVGGIFVPESPYWLVQKERREHAELSLFRTFGTCRKERNREMLQDIVKSYDGQYKLTIFEQICSFAEKKNWKPLLLTMAIFVLRELGGQMVVFAFFVHTFKEAGVGSDHFTAAVYVTLLRLIFNIVSCVFQDFVPRKTILFSSFILSGLALLTCGGHMMIYVDSFHWCSFASALIYIISYGVGVGPVPWIIMGEMIPSPVRYLGTTLVIMIYTMCQFIAANSYPYFMSAVGIGPAFVFFAILNIGAAVMIWIYLPETSGMSLLDLQDIFEAKRPLYKGRLEPKANNNHEQYTPVLGTDCKLSN